MKETIKTGLTFLIAGVLLMSGMRAVDELWPKPVRLIVCFESDQLESSCEEWKDIIDEQDR